MHIRAKKSRENEGRAAAQAVGSNGGHTQPPLVIMRKTAAPAGASAVQRMMDESPVKAPVIQRTTAGAWIGGALGTLLGATGFLAGPVVGGLTTLAGAGLGSLALNYLTGPNLVSIAENEVKSADEAEPISYPSVTSCMTITLVLANGKKVGGHIGLYAGPVAGVIGRMNAARNGVAVTTILAKGHGSIWGSHLENTDELRPRIREEFLRRHPDEDFHSIDYEEFGEIQGTLSLQQNQGAFTAWLAPQFGGGNVIYQNAQDGAVYINANGNFG